MQSLYVKTPKLSVSDDDGSSMSDVAASTADSDGFRESASMTDSETASQSGEGEDVSDEDAIVPVSSLKRRKSLRPSPSRKRTKRSDLEVSNAMEDSEDTDKTALSTPPTSTRKKSAKDYQKTNKYTYRVGIDENLQPLYKIEEIFEDMTARACKLGFKKVVNHLKNRKLRVATMCSGTESPILALRLVSDALKKEGIRFEIQQIFAAEIVPWKQSYGVYNFGPPIILRDVREFSKKRAVTATTAYGALVPIPGDLDLLVAGFSCVDFSGLNNKKKTLEAGGESGDTFKGIRDYAERWRPRIIILENVSGAPWDRIRDQAMVAIGYRAEYLKVDTKDYYLPHTRVRGYMVCVDAREHHDLNGVNHIPKSPQLMTSILKTWVDTMKSLKRPASCSIEAFLLDEDDPRLSRAREELSERDNTRSRVIDWACCHGRHQDYRTALSLGSKRPITKWLEGGFCEPLDFMWIDFIRTQPERVQDMIDISFLRNLDRGFDHHFKTRILELSQNVDRVTDNTKAGVTGCITPTGIPFSTTRGGPLTGLEVLSIQGLPIDRLQLSRQKQSQLQDLAGNAMSSTVVGAAIVAALIASYQNLPAEANDVLKDEVAAPLSHICTEQHLKASTVVLSTYEPLSVAAVLEAAKYSVRMCICEGPLNVTSMPLQQCAFCQHTSCLKCGGNPLHAYATLPEEIKFQRRPPTIFADLIKKSIPMIVSLVGITGKDIAQLSKSYKDEIEIADWNILLAFVRRAFKSEFRFYSVKRSEIWTVRYECGDAHLELVISSDEIEWRLFGKPPPTDVGNSRLRQLLSHPVARMVPKGDDITQGTWQFWLPKVHQFAVRFSGRGGLTSSYEDRVGIVRYLDAQVWREYTVSIPDGARGLLDADICGDYRLLQDCGTASGALHIQTKKTENSKPIFLFLDPHSLHDPKEDCFIFSTDKRRLNYGDVRPTIARLDSKWRPQKLEKLEDSSTGTMRYRINNSTNSVTWAEAQLPKTVDCYVDGRWIDLPDVRFKFSRDEGGLSCCIASTLPLLLSPNSCDKAHVVFLGKAKLPERQVAPWSQNEWVEISSVDYSQFFKSQAWLTEKACILENFANWSYGNASSFTLCSNCAPSSPTIKWKLQAPKSSKKADDAAEPSYSRRKDVLKYIPFEDPEEAGRHERLLKNRPSPLVTQIFINDSGLVQLKLAINPETLMHRALAKLSSSQNTTGVILKWRLITTYSIPSKPSLPLFTLTDNKSDAEARHPPGFLYPLRPEQARSLYWMISQESGQGRNFREEETEEAVIPQIRWRAEGRAEKDVYVRGGLLADQVGYGKTVTTLALIASQRRQDADVAKAPVKGCIPLKATLILVPPQLPDQWDREVKKFLHKNDKYKVLVIKNLAALQNKTIAHFHEADIIIASWKICEGENYLFKVAQFAGMVELAEKSSGRASSVWYKEATKAVADHVDELKRGGEGLKDMIALKLAENEKRAMELVTAVPSKRLRGQAYQAAKEDPPPGSKRKYGQTKSLDPQARKPRPDDFGLEQLKKGKLNWTAMKCPLFELFRFSRIVVDEYTYVTGQESMTISYIQARCRWILSATPPLVDFIDIKNIARFLGIHLGIEDITPGVTKVANIKALEKEKTDSELFQSFKPSQSPAWHERRHEVAQRFLNQFARQNIADINAIKGSEHIRPVSLPAAERAIYLENSQNLLLNDLTIKKGRRNVDNDRTRRFQELADRSASPGEILMKCASHFTLDDTGIETSNALEACERIVAIRCEQAMRLKEDFRKRLKQAVWLNGECTITVNQYVNWRNHVDINAFGDIESMNEIKNLITRADAGRRDTDWRDFYITAEEKAELDKKTQRLKASKKAKIRKEIDSESEVELEESIPRTNRRVKPEGVDDGNKERVVFALREVTAELRRLSAELVNRRRCLRFFERVRELQQLYARHEENVALGEECACSKCGKSSLSPDSISILCQCGHIICDDCLGSRQNGIDECFAQGCDAANKPYQIIKAKELGVEANRDRSAKHYGKKIEDIVALVEKIPDDEQVLLFVQFSDLMAMIASAFKDNMITYSALGESGDPAKKLTEFQTNKEKSSMKKVLMLNIGDSSAAGSNLTNANHVIFVSPFLTNSDTLFNQAMTQAEGRARRYGQLKHVHIYRFLSLKTIDVDVIQARNKGKFIAKNWAAEPEVKPFASFLPSTFDLVEEQKCVFNEFGSGEAGNKILGL